MDQLFSNLRSDFLFAQPSGLFGAARLLDLGGNFDSYNRSRTGEEADQRALTSDWMMMSKDFDSGLDVFLGSHPELCSKH